MSYFFCDESTIIIDGVTFFVNDSNLKKASIRLHPEGIGAFLKFESALTLLTEDQVDKLISIGVSDLRNS